MADTIFQVQEVHIDRTQNVRVGETDWYEPMDSDLASLYRNWVAEYGRCTGKMFQDSKDGNTYHVGYVFVKRIPYETSSSNLRRGEKPGSYLREMWCSWRTLKRDPSAAAPGLAHMPMAQQYKVAA